MKKVLSILLALALLLAVFPASLAEGAASRRLWSLPDEITLTSQTVPMYLTEAANKDEITLYFVNGQTDIPYIDMQTANDLIEDAMQLNGDDKYELTMSQEGTVVTLTRENGSSVSIDFSDDTMAWDNYNLFTAMSFATTNLDAVGASGFNAEGEPELFQRTDNTYVREGEDIGIRFSDFFIDLIYEDGVGYMPLQTVSDLFIAYSYLNMAYNGEAVFMILNSDLTDMTDLYYAVEPRERSEALAHFNYVELCLSLQFNYGLKNAHNIPSFGTLFELTGMEDRLMSPNAEEANIALYDVVSGHIDDLHTSFRSASPYAGNIQIQPTIESVAMKNMRDNVIAYYTASSEFYPESRPNYEEIGNTAYVTFDRFEYDGENDYYGGYEKGDLVKDTIGLIMHAQKQITRENSPIENVVIDLSTNLGGTVDAAVYTIAWFLGECTLSLADAINGALSTTTYKIDTNCDRVFDEKDTVAHLNRYCIISPISFSCGNLVPAVFKNSSEVTLLGRRSGGGACAVQPLITADGTLWQISGKLQLSTLINGSYYDVDKGVEPDITLTKLQNFYNREKLTEYLNNLI